MARIPRILINSITGGTVYHIMSRTALDGFPMKDDEKDYLLKLMKQFSRLYLVEILGFCCMDNHFHLLVRMLPDSDFTDEEIQRRFEQFHADAGDGKSCVPEDLPGLRKKLSTLSDFVREIKLGFTRFYNREHKRRGFFWGGRFKSVIVENGETLINCLAYIDLNPVRAGIVEKPEEYRWNSIGYHIQTENRDDFLSLDFGLKVFGILDSAARLKEYQRFLYETGAMNKKRGEEIRQEESQKARKAFRVDRFKSRTRYFSDACIIGSKEFVRSNYERIKHLFQSINDKIPKVIQGLDGIYSLKRLTEESAV